MYKWDAQEAEPICKAVLSAILMQAPTQGRPGSDLRTAVGDFLADAETFLITDTAGPPLENIFRLSQTNNISFSQMEYVRGVAISQNAVSPGAILIRDALVKYSLATEGLILANTTFVSRDDVEAARSVVNAAFAPSEEAAADAMDSQSYQSLINLHAAISYYLTQTAMPLPQMLNFAFAGPLSTLVAAYRLYTDASRADELLAENHVVHPAFMRPTGRALSN
jgi:prophage DNA circulation protein